MKRKIRVVYEFEIETDHYPDDFDDAEQYFSYDEAVLSLNELFDSPEVKQVVSFID